jgi:hypothetical protein
MQKSYPDDDKLGFDVSLTMCKYLRNNRGEIHALGTPGESRNDDAEKRRFQAQVEFSPAPG